MDVDRFKKILNSMSYQGKIQVYFLNRESVDKYRLQVHHKINGVTMCVLMEFDCPVFNVEAELERLKYYMRKNYKDYLEEGMNTCGLR